MEERPTCSSSHANPHPPPQQRHPQDEISLFLHQVLLRSSSNLPRRPSLHPPTASSSSHALAGYFLGNVGANVCPSSVAVGVGTSENEGDEYDYDSEGLEAFLEEVPEKPNPPRSSSKRSRTAEVHNLSEKRRRSRINEKMKALQRLIPNSNKTDKASMLDEAIEYLKQLQLQVQMLSMRNGLSLHPLCLPGVATPIQLGDLKMGFSEENASPDINSGAQHHVDRPTAAQTTLSGILHDGTIPSIVNSELPFGLDYSSTSIQAHPIAFQLKQPSTSQEVMNQSIGDPPILGGPSYSLSKSGGFDVGSAAGGSLDLLPERSDPSNVHEAARR